MELFVRGLDLGREIEWQMAARCSTLRAQPGCWAKIIGGAWEKLKARTRALVEHPLPAPSGSVLRAKAPTFDGLAPLDSTSSETASGNAKCAKNLQEVTGENIKRAWVDQSYTGETPKADAARPGIALEVVKQHEAKHGFVLIPRRWVVERSFGWAARYRRLAPPFAPSDGGEKRRASTEKMRRIRDSSRVPCEAGGPWAAPMLPSSCLPSARSD